MHADRLGAGDLVDQSVLLEAAGASFRSHSAQLRHASRAHRLKLMRIRLKLEHIRMRLRILGRRLDTHT